MCDASPSISVSILCGFVTIALLLAMSPSMAMASDGQRAQELFNEGAELYLEEEYSAAIVRFRQANNIHPHSLFKYNIAMAELRRGRVQSAASAAEEAREMEPALPPENRARADSIIAGDAVVTTTLETVDRLEPDEDSPDRQDIEPPAEPSVAEATFGPVGWGGISALAVGTVALGGAGYVDAQIRSHRRALDERSDQINSQELQRQAVHISTWQTRGQAMLFSGLFLTVTGTALLTVDLLTGNRDNSADEPAVEAKTTITPTVTTPGVQLHFRW